MQLKLMELVVALIIAISDIVAGILVVNHDGWISLHALWVAVILVACVALATHSARRIVRT